MYKWYAFSGTRLVNSIKNLNICLPFDLTLEFLGMYSKTKIRSINSNVFIPKYQGKLKTPASQEEQLLKVDPSVS